MRISDWSSDVCSSDLWRNCEHCLIFVRSAGMFSSVHVPTIGVDSKLLLPDLSALVKSGQDGVAFSTPKRSGSIWPTAARVSGLPREIVPTLAKYPIIDRKSVVSGTSGQVRIDHGGRMSIQQTT